MELTKTRNLIEHELEIKARPARTWFQTTQEKNLAKSELDCACSVLLFPSDTVF